MDAMRDKVAKQFVRTIEASLARIGVSRDATILVALSGGPDSVAMLHALRAMPYRIVAAHLNHGIRGDEADRDEAFVRNLCARCDIEIIVERARGLSADIPNLEERAREARHAFLDAAADRVGADYIALAHHADDQAETVLMRMLRGAGAAGLAAMAERGPGRIIRPMLDVTRVEVLAYLKSIGEQFVNDSSNQSSALLRSRIRTELMPMLERNYAPGLRGRLVQLAAEMRALDDFVAQAARRELETLASDDILDISRFAQLHPAVQAELIRQYIRHATGNLRRIERVHIEAIRRLCLDGPPNGALDIPGMHLVREYSRLRIAPPGQASSEPFMVRLEVGSVEVPQAGFMFETKVIARGSVGTPESKFEALFDASAASEGLLVRSFRPGDRIAPLGVSGHRKITDIFVDNKVPVARRASFPIVELRGAIAWVPGMVRGKVGLLTEASERLWHVRAAEMRIPRH
jgi:tRNA(Ile)-lysidine synthase